MSLRRLAAAAPIMAVLCAASPLHAQDERFSVNTWIGGSASHSGSFGAVLTYAPGGVRRSGLRWQGLALRGFYRYPSAAAAEGMVRGRYTDVGVALGYEAVRDGRGFLVAMGPSLYDKDLSHVAPGERVGRRWGAKVSVLGYAEVAGGPSVFAFGGYSTADATANLYSNLGFATRFGLSVGPEVAFLDASDYRQTRLGVHVSGLRLGALEVGLSAGRTRDMDGNRGNHLGVNARTIF